MKSLSERIAETIHQIELAKSEHLKTIKELDAAFEDKKPEKFIRRHRKLHVLFMPASIWGKLTRRRKSRIVRSALTGISGKF